MKKSIGWSQSVAVKAVIDTMIWVSFCTRVDGYRHRLIERARRARVRLFVSSYILDEIYRVLTEDFTRSQRFGFLARRAVLRRTREVILPQNLRRWVTADPGDDPIIETALTAGAGYLVTADTELLKLGKVQGVEIITAAQFDQLLPVMP
jgi:putative PIN family toxin of toxin-antitoxin system